MYVLCMRVISIGHNHRALATSCTLVTERRKARKLSDSILHQAGRGGRGGHDGTRVLLTSRWANVAPATAASCGYEPSARATWQAAGQGGGKEAAGRADQRAKLHQLGGGGEIEREARMAVPSTRPTAGTCAGRPPGMAGRPSLPRCAASSLHAHTAVKGNSDGWPLMNTHSATHRTAGGRWAG